ncbi:unnamed protein product, partial [Polarella glacialis]
VTDAFDLQRAVKGSRPQAQADGDSGADATRMAALEREAASMLRSLFDFRSVGVIPPPPPPRPATREAAPAPLPPAPVPQQQQASPSSATPGPASAAASGQAAEQDWPGLNQPVVRAAPPVAPAAAAPGERRTIRVCRQRQVHNDGGLRVVDDTEFDEEYEDEYVEQEVPSAADEPTPAQALTAAPKAPGKKKIARLPRAGGEGAQITFAVTGGTFGGRGGAGGGASASSSARPRPSAPEDDLAEDSDGEEGEATALEVESWIPDWATTELHERTLSEVE